MDPKDEQNKQKKEVVKTKRIRVIVVDPSAWEKIAAYVNDMPIAFANAKRAAEVQDLFALAQMMEIEVPDIEKKEPQE